MKKRPGKRILAFLMSMVFMLSTAVVGVNLTASAKSDYKAPFDENNIKVRFSVMSDTHIQGKTSNSSMKFKKALAQVQTFKDLSGIVINGDVTDYGMEDQIHVMNDILAERMNKGLDLKKTRLLLNMGNHELYDAELNHGDQGGGIPTQAEAKPHYHGANTFKKILGDKMYTDDATTEQLELGFQHTELQGYHLILFSLFDYNHGLRYEKREFEWLQKALKEANAADPNKPIFFFMHAAIKGTNLGSEQGGYWATDSQELYDELAKYPQVIAFGSHLHYPLQDEREIHQKDFTAVDTGSVYYTSVPTSMVNPLTGEKMVFQNLNGAEPKDCMEFSQGLLIEVDGDNNTRIHRLDFYATAQSHASSVVPIKEPWIVPSVKDEHHLTQYSKETLEANNVAPQFTKEAKVKVLPNDPETDPYKNFLNMEFQTATDDDMVLAYELKFIEAESKKTITTQYVYSDYYLHPNPNEMSGIKQVNATKRSLYPMMPNYPYDYVVEVRAVDCFGMKSQPITSAVQPGDPSGLDETPAPTLDPQAQWGYIPFTDYDYLKVGYTPGKDDFDSWPTADATEFHPYVPVTNNGFNHSPAITKQVKGTANQFDVITNSDDAVLEKYYHTNCEGATEFWIWVDFSQVKFDYLYFGFRESKFYGTEYQTKVAQPMENAYYYIQDGKGGWTARPFHTDGTMDIGNYKGFIRFDVEYFCNPENNAPMYPDNIKTFKMWFSLDDEQDYTGKEFIIDQIGFAGPNLKNPTMTVGEMKAMDGSDKVTTAELKAAYDGAKSKMDAGQGSYDKSRYDAFVEAYHAVGKLVENPGDAAQTFDAYMALKTAMDNLNKPAEVDKKALEEAVAAAKKDMDAGQGNFTTETWDVYAAAYDAAVATLEDKAATQEAVNKAVDALKAAKDGLKENEPVDPEKPVDPDKPVGPDKPTDPENPNSVPQTGDISAAVMSILAVLAVACGGLAYAVRRRKCNG